VSVRPGGGINKSRSFRYSRSTARYNSLDLEVSISDLPGSGNFPIEPWLALFFSFSSRISRGFSSGGVFALGRVPAEGEGGEAGESLIDF